MPTNQQTDGEKMIRANDFWKDLTDAFVTAANMRLEAAASMMAEFLDDYHDVWPHIESDIAANPLYEKMLSRALQIRDAWGVTLWRAR